MATRSNFRLGYIAVNYVNEGSDTDISAYLGTHKVYPLISLENAVVTCASTTYNGSNQAAQSITVTSNGVTLTKNVDYSIIENAGGIVAGNYTVTVKGIGNYCDTKSGTFTINKANQSAPTAYGASVAYGNTATATTSGGGGQGSIEWSNGNTLTGNAGSSKTTKARWSGNSNYNPSPYSNEVTLSIVKANQSAPTAYGATTTYSTTATASASGGGGQGSIEWSNGNTQTSVGSKSTQARWSGNSNYNASSWSNSVTLTMNKASQNAPTVTGATTTYPTTATATASGGGGQGSIEWESAQSQTSIGSHTTRARWTGNGNYNASPWSNTVTVKMDKISISATVSISNWTYGETASNPQITIDGSSNGAVTYYYKVRTAADSTYTTTKPSNAGNYTIKATVAETTTYKGTSCTNTFTINKATGNATISFYNGEYTGSTITLASASDNTGTVHYRVGTNGSWTTTPPTAKNPGSWDIYYYVDESTNYNGKYSSSTPGHVSAAISDKHKGYELVDLGLPSGTKWATMNVGASVVTDKGNHYMWGYGDTVYDSSQTALDDPSGNRNLTDNEDTARKAWGGSWHMPTKAQIQELTNINNTTKSTTTVDGVYMYKIISKYNSNYVLFPYPGYYQSDGTFWNEDNSGYYWSRTPDASSNAYILGVNRLSENGTYWSEPKDWGCSVRPVIG